MDEFRRRRVIRGLREIDMIEMKPTGRYGLTKAGEDFLDQIEVLRELDDRPAAAEQQAGRSTPEPGTRAGDDVRPARRAREKGTR